MQKKIKIQHIYILFLAINISMGIRAVIIALGIFMILYWILVCRKTKVAQDMLYMGIFVSLLGMWLLGEEPGVSIIFDNRPYASFLAYTLLMLMGISFLMFVKFFLGAGDRYLTDSANLIKKIFGRYGKIYRIGGDEFCIIMKNTSEDKIISLIQQLTQDADIDQTRCRADVLMYENKKQLKAVKNK